MPTVVKLNDKLIGEAVKLGGFKSKQEAVNSAVAEFVQRRVAASRRAVMVREVGQARATYRAGKVKRGSATELMAELRAR